MLALTHGRIVKYPDSGDGVGQGVGPHKDSMLTSYLLQASPHKGLQAQNTRGEWIDCPPIRGTLVVAIGQGLEALTGGVCASTTHRVISPKGGEGARFSIPFFQGVSYDAKFESMDVPDHVRALRQNILEKEGGRKDDVEFTFVKGRWNHLGEATLMNRVKSHPDVSERWCVSGVRSWRALSSLHFDKQVPRPSCADPPAAGRGSYYQSCPNRCSSRFVRRTKTAYEWHRAVVISKPSQPTASSSDNPANAR